MSNMAKINITAEEREVIDVTLVGVDYAIIPPKSALALKVAKQAKKAGDDPDQAFDALRMWLEMSAGKESADSIMGRLEDTDDLLDVSHISQLISAVTEAVAENPTSSSSATRK